ncbi:MAG: GAF domain-containing protein [bacterium]
MGERDLRERLERRNLEFIALKEVSKAITSTVDLQELYVLSVDVLVEVMQVENGAMFVEDENTGDFAIVASKGYKTAIDSINLKKDDALTDWLISFGLPVTMEKMKEDPRFSQLPEIEKEKLAALEAEVFVPLKVKAKVIGIFCLGRKLSRDRYAFEELELFYILASQVSSAIYNARLYNELEKTNRRLDKKVFDLYAINELGKAISSTLNLDELLNLLVDMLVEILRANRGLVMLYDEVSGDLKVYAQKGYSHINLEGFTMGGDDLMKALAQISSAILLQDRRAYQIIPEPHREKLMKLGCAMLVPMVVKDKPIGVVCLSEKEGSASFSPDEIELSSTLGGQAAVAIENALIYESVIVDRLTSVYTLKYFNERLDEELSRAQRYHKYLSVAILSPDGLPSLTERYGRKGVNLLLRDMAKLIKRVIRASDLIARYDDNFVLIIHETDTRTIPFPLNRMRRVIKERGFTLGQDKVEIAVSIGAAIFPIHAINRKDLMDRAKLALERAIKSGGDSSVVYER